MKKLIEVALPLDAINAAAAKEKSIRHGHPSTLHLWWARRPLAAARAVIFAQMVDDPSEYIDELMLDTERIENAQRRVDEVLATSPESELLLDDAIADLERQRIFRIIESMVRWENVTNDAVIDQARAEIRRSWARRHIGIDVALLSDAEILDNLDTGKLPPLPSFHDPFAGGGALPLEAQRLGLESWATDLNPVAVMINKALIELPPQFANLPPISPAVDNFGKSWTGAKGLAEDVRQYGKWLGDEAYRKIGHLYPNVEVTPIIGRRKDLEGYVGQTLNVIAWIWARTVKSPNPVHREIDVPLISNYILSNKKGKEVWLKPIVCADGYEFEIQLGTPPSDAKSGTKLGRGANFECILSGAVIDAEYIRQEGRNGRIGQKLIAVVCEGNRTKLFLEPTSDCITAARVPRPEDAPTQSLYEDALGFRVPNYGYNTWSSLYSPRQLTALTTFTDLIPVVNERIRNDLAHAKDDRDDSYSTAIVGYLALALDRLAMSGNNLVRWNCAGPKAQHCFGRHTLSMLWDFAETNPFGTATGSLSAAWECVADPLQHLGYQRLGYAIQAAAQSQDVSRDKVISTDPPYYDNIGYADLSDLFYVWLRRALKPVFPDLFSTLTVPKAEELVATPARHGGSDAAESFFMNGMTRVMARLSEHSMPGYPVTIYYAFKQSETVSGATTSTGWETFLSSVVNAGFVIDGTWPMRTEMKTRMRSMGSNALASSIVLVCRRRPNDVGITSRRAFQAELRRELPIALRHLQSGNIAPVDMAQSAIGPGMGIYSKYARVVEADGSEMPVRTALALINEVLDQVLAEQEGELDPESRWAVAWFTEYGYGESSFGRADDLARAKNTAVEALKDAGIIRQNPGKVSLLRRDELPTDWDPTTDRHLVVWEAVQHLIRIIENKSESDAAVVLARLGGVADLARDLAYRLYGLCDRQKNADEARAYNTLIIAWPELQRLAEDPAIKPKIQGELGLDA